MKSAPAPVIFFASAALFLGAGGGLLLFSEVSWQHEPVQAIRITGQSYLTKNELIQLSRIKTGKRYTKIDLNKIASVLQSHPIVLAADVGQESANIHISIKERQCAALLEEKRKGMIYDIDASGRILSTTKPRCQKVPLIRGNFKRKGEHFSGQGLEQLIEALGEIRKIYPDLIERLSEIRLNGEGSLTLSLLHSRLRVELPLELNNRIIRRLYASVAYLLSKKIKDGWVDLRGSEAILHTGL